MRFTGKFVQDGRPGLLVSIALYVERGAYVWVDHATRGIVSLNASATGNSVSRRASLVIVGNVEEGDKWKRTDPKPIQTGMPALGRPRPAIPGSLTTTFLCVHRWNRVYLKRHILEIGRALHIDIFLGTRGRRYRLKLNQVQPQTLQLVQVFFSAVWNTLLRKSILQTVFPGAHGFVPRLLSNFSKLLCRLVQLLRAFLWHTWS